ncbi:hypothetical protein [Yersinia aldovae]|uniref:Uncharacterized protein n=1 Tax=Yersinia aldovae TaxID=29483 RepID=A0ABM9ST06_YERAL|nr:hypothetical protein [Yersinia aldovae]CNL03799.1 Uncharacterised protein [Yersinia aldovae]
MEATRTRLNFPFVFKGSTHFKLKTTALKFLVKAFKGNHCFFAHAVILNFQALKKPHKQLVVCFSGLIAATG